MYPFFVKDGLSFKIKNLHIHWYFTATKYNAFVENKDN